MRWILVFFCCIGITAAGLVAQSPKSIDRPNMDLETKLAKASFTRVENRDPQKTYNKMTLAELRDLGRGFDWKAYFDQLGVKQVPDIDVRQPIFFKAFAEMCSSIPPEQWRTYLKWHVISGMASLLTRAFEEESFAFAQSGQVPRDRPAERFVGVL